MKLLHLADLHLGKSLGEYDLYEDQRFLLRQILERIPEYGVDAVLIAGDVYDRSVPPEAAVSLLDWFLRELAGRQVRTFLISGNHDSDERLHFGSALFEQSGISIVSKYDGTLRRYVLEDAFGEVSLYLLPFVKASQVRHFYPEETIETYEDAVKVILKHSDFDPGRRNVLVAHQFVAGKEDPVRAGSEGMSVLQVGNVERIGYGCLEAFDYVALGHIHCPQAVGCDQIRYAGSLMKYSLSEAGSEKTMPLVTLKEKGECLVELLPLVPMRDLRHIKGKMKQLLDPANITDPEDFIYVTLTEEDVQSDAMGIFQQYYPNTVRIDYENAHTRELEQSIEMTETEGRPFEELFADFYRMIYGCGMNPEEQKIILSAAKEAGVIHEAD